MFSLCFAAHTTADPDDFCRVSNYLLMLRLGTGDPALDYLRLTFPVPVDDRVAIPLQTKQALLLFKVFK